MDQECLSLRQRAFVEEYSAHFCLLRAARNAGYARGNSANRLLKRCNIQRALQAKLEERSLVSDLTANYVRDYIQSILEFHPTDYFILGPDNCWMIDPETFRNLPHEVKRLVDGVEMRIVAGRCMFTVNFISKAAALSLAARFTLTQKVQAEVSQVPWEEICGQLDEEAEDSVEAMLARVEPVQVEKPAVAGRAFLP
jgi:phage terminase small subunit